MKQYGSQSRDMLADSGMRLVGEKSNANTVTLQDIETGKKELWVKNDHYAGYVIEIDGVGYEFVSSRN